MHLVLELEFLQSGIGVIQRLLVQVAVALVNFLEEMQGEIHLLTAEDIEFEDNPPSEEDEAAVAALMDWSKAVAAARAGLKEEPSDQSQTNT